MVCRSSPYGVLFVDMVKIILIYACFILHRNEKLDELYNSISLVATAAFKHRLLLAFIYGCSNAHL